jgi:signal transduction histidine kinase
MTQSGALSFSKIKGWFSSPDAIGYPLVVFALIWPFATGFLVGETPGAEFEFSIHLYDLTGSSLVALILLAFRLPLRRAYSKQANSTRNAFLTVVAIVISAAGGALLTVQIVGSFSSVPDIYRESVPFGFISYLATCLIFVFVWSAIKEQRSALRSLATARKSLAFLRANLKSELEQNRAALKTQIQAVLEPTFNQLVSELKSGASNEALAVKLKQAIDSVVRPLSHELADQNDSAEVSALKTIRQFEKSITRIPLRERWSQQILMREAVSIPLVVIAHIVFVIPSTIFLNGVPGYGAAFLAALVITCSNFGYIKLAGDKSSKYIRVLAISLILSVISSAIYFMVLTVVVQDSDAASVTAVAVSVFISNFVTGFFSCQLSFRESSLASAAEVNAKLQESVTALKQDVWLNRRRFARLVHGSVQANLQSAAIRLKRGNQTGDVSAGALAEELAQSLNNSLANQSQQPRLTSALESLKEFWAGACDLTISAEPALLSRIESNQQTAECLYELISEAVSNAVKHAEADEVDVQIFQADDLIQVEIRNIQTLTVSAANANVAGYGSRIYDEITSSWSLTFDESDAILKATLPLTL